jgi:cytochrome c oxidase subunit 3
MELTLKEVSRSKIHPLKFALWVGCGSILMMFASMTSAYIVRHAQGNWLEFPLPNVFYLSTGLIFFSSVTLHAAYLNFKKGNEKLYKLLLTASLILGVGFLVSQYQGWQAMKNLGVFLDGNPSGSFIYVLSGIHAAHVLGGVAAISVAMLHAFLLTFGVTEKRKLRFELTLTYWHFVDFLWLYLLFFLLTQ